MLMIAERVGVRYPAAGCSGVTAIEEIELRAEPGAFCSLLGPSGCGKSTLLKVFGGLVAPTSGQASVGGELVKRPSPRVAMVFQEPSLFPWRTLRENVAFGLEVRGVSKAKRYSVADEMIHLVGLAPFSNAYPSQLSGGMQQRGAIARALAVEPEVLLMDEPFGALDEQTRLILGAELRRIWLATGKTILFVTHSIQESILLSTQIALFSARPGRIKKNFTVDLSDFADRESALGSEQFRDIEAEIWGHLRSESLHAMSNEFGEERAR